MTADAFPPPSDNSTELEAGTQLTPRFNTDGLITAIAQDAASGAILMVAHMNAQALSHTLQTGQAWYWSRSRGALWRKGETSGHTQRVIDVRIDCDQDAVLVLVEQTGPACHTGAQSCFYRRVTKDQTLERVDDDPAP